MKKALIIVDYQFDFANPKGSLYVKDAETLKNYIEKLILEFKKNNDLVIATMDWHPENHNSFNNWPKHCIQNHPGAKLLIEEKNYDYIIKKGINPKYESYSGFYDDNGTSNGLDEYLKKHKITELTLVGVALDICVNATFNDAIKLGYKTIIDINGCKGITNKITTKIN